MNQSAPLNALLRDELAAVATYRCAIDHVKQPDAHDELVVALAAHERRVEALRERVQQLGGAPASTPGAWGRFIRLLERGASEIGDRTAVAVLEIEEARGRAHYRAELSKLDPESRRLVEETLLPAQESNYRALSTLRMALH